MMLMPLMPLMTVTPSLQGFFYGILAGAVVVGAAAVSLVFISQQDKIQRQ